MKSNEIKFRAWDKHKKEWRWNNKTLIDLAVDYSKTEAEDNPFYEYDDLEIMQYTGIKDKNGKEIYEGDICEDKNNGDRVLIKYDLHGSRFATWTNENNPTNVSAEKIIDDWGYVVIGNIYKNKELIKE